LGVIQGDTIRNIYGTFAAETEDYQHSWPSYSGAFYVIGETFGDGEPDDEDYEYRLGFNASRIVPTANENRPVNVAVRYLIRALP
jgi:hypothetical protein